MTAGIVPDPAWVRPLRDPCDPMQEFEDLGRSAMGQWLAADWRALGCTALLAHNDETAVGVIEVLQDAGVQVPGEVSVVGFDGLDIADYFRPRLTTIEVPLEEIGAQGARLLLRHIREGAATSPALDQDGAGQLELACRLKIGDSSGSPRSPSRG